LDTNQLDIRNASTYQTDIQSVDLDLDLLTKEKPCDACNGMNMTKSQICKGGAPYELNALNQSVQKDVYFEIMNSIIEPPKSKKKFAITTEATKQEIVLIELKQKLDPKFRSAIYNIAHIYGGTDVGFSIFCHIDALPSVREIIDEEWSNIRIFNVSQPGKKPTYPHEYNRLVTGPEFWANFQSRFVLITQSDVAIFRKLDDWMFDYSMIGAPWPHWPENQKKPRVGNGGYTLRHVDSMKTVLLTNNYTAEHSDGGYVEDIWWHSKIQNLPSEELAFEFSFELDTHGSTFDHLKDFIPTGAHKQSLYSPMKHMGKAFRFLQEQYGRCI
jgi:hypothetical protein